MQLEESCLLNDEKEQKQTVEKIFQSSPSFKEEAALCSYFI